MAIGSIPISSNLPFIVTRVPALEATSETTNERVSALESHGLSKDAEMAVHMVQVDRLENPALSDRAFVFTSVALLEAALLISSE